MKKRLLAAYIFCLPFMAFAQSNADVLHYKFNIGLSDDNDTLYGEAEITIHAKKGTNNLTLDLSGDMFGKIKGMTVEKVNANTENKRSDRTSNPFVHADNKLTITIWPELQKDDTIIASIKYKGIPENGLIISRNKYGKRTFFGDNWPNRAHYWLPCVDDPADKASVEFIVTAPHHYQVVANGVLEEETNLPGNKKLTHWKEDVPLPTKVMVIGVAEFSVQNAGTVNNCIPVSSWVFPENRKDGFYDYATANDVLAWHINYIGPYAYKKLANVQSKTMFGGMENASAIFYYEGSVTGTRSEEELQSHEIVHQWFGNHATEKSFAHLWLSEGFATYLTHVYMESKYGTDSLNKRMSADRETVLEFVKISKRPVVDSTSDYMRLLNANSYQKGSWVLHMLRRQLGDNVFHKSIRDYYALYGGKNADSQDLQRVFEINSGKKLDTFFDQWLNRPVNPKLDISWKNLPASNKVEITVTQLQDSAPFELPLDIGLKFSGKLSEIKKLFISKKTEVFTLNAVAPLLSLHTDPLVSLLCETTVTAK